MKFRAGTNDTPRKIMDQKKSKPQQKQMKRADGPQARQAENLQSMTELKYLKGQLAAKEALIKAQAEQITALKEALAAAARKNDPILEQVRSDAEGQRPGKFAPAGTPVAGVTQA